MNLQKGILAIDVGSGTQDILLWQPNIPVENCPKIVVPSATTILGRLIDEATKKGNHIYLHGKTMGGGPCSSAIHRHLKVGLKVFALEKPALTFHDNIEYVKRMGIEIVGSRPNIEPLSELRTGDINLDPIGHVFSLFHIPIPDTVAVAVQDHGFSPRESNRAFRFKQWEDLLESGQGFENLGECRVSRGNSL